MKNQFTGQTARQNKNQGRHPVSWTIPSKKKEENYGHLVVIEVGGMMIRRVGYGVEVRCHGVVG